MNDNAPLILFVDDETTAVKYFQRALESLAPVATAGSVEEGMRKLDEHAATLTVLVSDQRMPGGIGNELLAYARNRHPHIVRILTTAYSELEQTIEAVNRGQIHRYIQKPWEIAALRMELKQALELAALRKEHAQLLREKLIVRQTQAISHRIGVLYTLCAILGGPASIIDGYLAAAGAAGVNPPEPDWLLMDHSDLVGAEAVRNGQFGEALKRKLDEKSEEELLSEMDVEITDNGLVLFGKAPDFSEFLETDLQVSSNHVSWLAWLTLLHRRGKSIELKKTEEGFEGMVVDAHDRPLSGAAIAAWVSQFTEQ